MSRAARPVGSERVKKGYVQVKVAERPSRPGLHDNWVPKHKLVYEAAYGPVPDGCAVFFADHDRANFDPGNLVAVPKRLVGPMNENASRRGMTWSDRGSLLACMAYAELSVAINDAPETAECAVCGSPFAVDRRRRRMLTCPSCREGGLRPRCEPGSRGGHGTAECKRCGATFERDRRSQVNCPDCIGRDRRMPSRARLLGKEPV